MRVIVTLRNANRFKHDRRFINWTSIIEILPEILEKSLLDGEKQPRQPR